MPGLFEPYVHTGPDADSLPKPEVPYYAITSEGVFLHRTTQIGTVLLKETKPLKALGKTGYPNGVFTWEGPKIPATIISQAYDFFRRIYEKHKTEAEVIITKHNDTEAFRLFVPFQRVSSAGVKSVYEPTHIDRNYTVVGTLHSHCMMNAFHSATDSGDASDMDGVHFTIGKVLDNPPQIVAMVVMGGTEFHYPDPTTIADIAFDADTAPEWWDSYVYPADTASDKPKSLKSITQAQWDEFRGIVAAKTHHTPSEVTYRGGSYWREPRKPSPVTYHQPTRESVEFNKRNYRNKTAKYPYPIWDEYDGSLLLPPPATIIDISVEDEAINKAIDTAYEMQLLSGDEFIGMNVEDMDDITYWQRHFTKMLTDCAELLDILGMDTRFTITPKKTQPPAKGQTTIEQLLAQEGL